MDYYGQLQLPVSQVLTSNLDHFTEYDKDDLDQYTGEFILGIRPDGTDLYLMHPNRYQQEAYGKVKRSIDLNYNNLFENGNIRFYYGKDGVVQLVIRSYAIQILREYTSQVMAHFQHSELLIKK